MANLPKDPKTPKFAGSGTMKSSWWKKNQPKRGSKEKYRDNEVGGPKTSGSIMTKDARRKRAADTKNIKKIGKY